MGDKGQGNECMQGHKGKAMPRSLNPAQRAPAQRDPTQRRRWRAETQQGLDILQGQWDAAEIQDSRGGRRLPHVPDHSRATHGNFAQQRALNLSIPGQREAIFPGQP